MFLRKTQWLTDGRCLHHWVTEAPHRNTKHSECVYVVEIQIHREKQKLTYINNKIVLIINRYRPYNNAWTLHPKHTLKSVISQSFETKTNKHQLMEYSDH